MVSTTLIVPGLHGSGATHWQTWIEAKISGARRVDLRDRPNPVLAEWSQRLASAINRERHPLWIVAHGFGCLAAMSAARYVNERVAGALLVAPENPERFNARGLQTSSNSPSIACDLPQRAVDFPVIVVASTNDPWLRFTTAHLWSERWGARLVNLGPAGHIDAESGFGPWPFGLSLFESLRDTYRWYPRGEVDGTETVATQTRARERDALSRQWFA